MNQRLTHASVPDHYVSRPNSTFNYNFALMSDDAFVLDTIKKIETEAETITDGLCEDLFADFSDAQFDSAWDRVWDSARKGYYLGHLIVVDWLITEKNRRDDASINSEVSNG